MLIAEVLNWIKEKEYKVGYFEKIAKPSIKGITTLVSFVKNHIWKHDFIV